MINTEIRLPCGNILPNRICKAAMTEGIADEYNLPNDKLINLYKFWGNGNAGGLLLTGNIQIDRRYVERPGNVCIDKDIEKHFGKDYVMKRFSDWAKVSKGPDGKSKIWAQISHAGRQSNPLVNISPVSPSSVATTLKGLPILYVPTELTVNDIQDIIEKFANGAKFLKECGFDGVEIHAAHGYLISSFLNPLANLRTDSYGGSLENRTRILLETYHAIRKSCGKDFPIGVKLNCADFIEGGLDISESVQIAKWLEKEGLDLLEISGGSYEVGNVIFGVDESSNKMVKYLPKNNNKKESTKKREAYFLAFADEIIKNLVSLPVMVTGGFRSIEAMEDALKFSGVSVIGIGRPFCGMPDGAKKLLNSEIQKLPSFDANELKFWWGIQWIESLPYFGTLLRLGFTQSWTYNMLIRMGDGKYPTTEISFSSSMLSHNNYDTNKASMLKLMPKDVHGLVYNRKPFFTMNKIGIIITIFALIFAFRQKRIS